MSVKKAAEIKSLETRRNKLQAQRKQLNIEIADKQKESSEMKRKIDSFQKEIEKLKNKKPEKLIISEHAMLRFIERVMHIDLTELQKKILPPEKASEIEKFGNCTYNMEDYKITIKDGIVVTVVSNDV